MWHPFCLQCFPKLSISIFMDSQMFIAIARYFMSYRIFSLIWARAILCPSACLPIQTWLPFFCPGCPLNHLWYSLHVSFAQIWNTIRLSDLAWFLFSLHFQPWVPTVSSFLGNCNVLLPAEYTFTRWLFTSGKSFSRAHFCYFIDMKRTGERIWKVILGWGRREGVQIIRNDFFCLPISR